MTRTLETKVIHLVKHVRVKLCPNNIHYVEIKELETELLNVQDVCVFSVAHSRTFNSLV